MDITLNVIWTGKPDTETVDHDSIIFMVRGLKKLNLDNTGNFWVFLKTLMNGGSKYLLFDMKNLAFIDSSGIGILINTAKLLRQSGGDMALMNVTDEITGILDLVNFRKFINICCDENEAKAFFLSESG